MNDQIKSHAQAILDIVQARQNVIKEMHQKVETARVLLTPLIKDEMALMKVITAAERSKEHISDKITTAQTKMTEKQFKEFFSKQEKHIEREINLQNDTTDQLKIIRKKLQDDRQAIRDMRKQREDHVESVREETKDDSLLLTLSKQLVNIFEVKL